MTHPNVELGAANLEAVRTFFATHLCASQVDCVKALGLSPMAVNRHVKTIRSEWKNSEAEK